MTKPGFLALALLGALVAGCGGEDASAPPPIAAPAPTPTPAPTPRPITGVNAVPVATFTTA